MRATLVRLIPGVASIACMDLGVAALRDGDAWLLWVLDVGEGNVPGR